METGKPVFDIPTDAKGRVYHLELAPEDIADIILLVGDPGRVDLVASQFSTRRMEHAHREFKTVTGDYNGKEVTVISTGIGTDNIDIVVHELDALANLDLSTGHELDEKRSLSLVRIGTCGLVQDDTEPGTAILSRFAIGLDNLAHFYHSELDVNLQYFQDHIRQFFPEHVIPYVRKADRELVNLLSDFTTAGITMTAPGFYGPQGRPSRARGLSTGISDALKAFDYQGLRIENFEMECSALYMLSDLLGHRAATVCLGIAQRNKGDFQPDYTSAMGQLIEDCLARLTA